MTPGATLERDPNVASALGLCVQSLQLLADYELEPPIQRRMTDLGERKEFLSAAEHDELLSLVAFTERRTAEKLSARLALTRLREVFPGAVSSS